MNATNTSSLLPIQYSIIVPVYNSSSTLEELSCRLLQVMRELTEEFEIIFVEDSSKDQSWEILETISETHPKVVAIQLMRNVGQGLATICGFSCARGEYIVTLDDDLQNPPEEIPKLLDALCDDPQIDVVIGVPEERQHSRLRNLGSYIVNKLNIIFLDKPEDLRFSSFRALRRTVLDGVLTKNVPYPALGPVLISVTRRIINIEVAHNPRKAGKSNYTFSRLLKQTLSNIIGYTVIPLHILACLGVLGILFSFIMGTFFLVRYLLWGTSVQGWVSLMLVSIAIGGFNFFAFAILGEYVKRIFYLQTTSRQFFIRTRK
jgi:glycosyltransferase involved in cell wall biosynthesis